jgi:acyl-CoA thioester hydrolase
MRKRREHTNTGAVTMYRAIETYRGFVYPWHIDHVGHMNVQFYTARFDEATWQFLNQLGLSPTHFKTTGRSAVAADQRTHYKREVLGGSLLHVTTELLTLGRSSLRFVHRMYDSETVEEVASTELVGVYFDTTRRVSVELPGFVHERAVGLILGAGLPTLSPLSNTRTPVDSSR